MNPLKAGVNTIPVYASDIEDHEHLLKFASECSSIYADEIVSRYCVNYYVHDKKLAEAILIHMHAAFDPMERI